MADFSPQEVTQLLQALQQGGGFDAAIQDALSALSAVEGAPAISKEQKKTADLILKLIPQSLQAELRRDIAAGNQGVALAKIQANANILQIRLSGAVELEGAKGARQIAVGEAKVEQDVLRKQLVGEAEIGLEQKRAQLAIPLVDPGVQAFINKQEAELRAIIGKTDTPLPSQTELNSRLNALKVPETNGVAKSEQLSRELNLRVDKAVADSERLLSTNAPEVFNNAGAKQVLLDGVKATGVPATAKEVQIARESVAAETAQIRRLAEVGVQVGSPGGGQLQVEEPAKRRFLPSPGDEVRKLVEQAETARLAGRTAESAELVSQIPKARRGASLGRGGKIAGGLAALLLLPKLLGGGGNEQAQNAQAQALQLQLLQQQQQSANQNALTQSLVQSRGSQSGLNEAKALLLRLQALQAGGAGGGGLV